MPGPTAGLNPGAKPTGTAGAGGGSTKPGGGDHVVPPGPTGTAGPTAPPASVPLGPHGLPDPETAKSGIDWNQILSDYGPPVRTVLEVGRLIPGWGLLAGFGADALNFQSDLASIPKSENADLATGLIVFRNFVNIGNNGLGHILYVNQLIQDGLAGSVVGAEFTPLTAAANEVLSGVKVGLDEVQMGTDIVIEVEALYESNHAPTSAEAEQWKQLADGYAANLLGDVVNITLDIISLASAGAANTAPVQQAREPLSLAGAFMKSAVPNIIGGLNGVIGVWLGNLMTAGRHAYEGSPTELREQALIYDVAGGFVDHEAGQARTTYTAVDAVIGAFEAYADQQIEQLNVVAGALSGGKTAFQLIRDAVQSGLEDMHNKLSMVEQLASLASNAQTNAAAISGACDTILGALDSLVIPSYNLPQVELGDSVLADATEYLANQATAAANALIRRTVANVQSRIDGVKDEVRGPVEAVQQKADNLGEWLALLATECGAMAGTLNGYIINFSEGLGKCTSAEQVMDLIIGQISDLTGMPKFTVQDMRDGWHSIGTYIDGYVALGQSLHQRATDLRQHADARESGIDAGPDFAPPPPLLPPGSGTGTAGRRVVVRRVVGRPPPSRRRRSRRDPRATRTMPVGRRQRLSSSSDSRIASSLIAASHSWQIGGSQPPASGRSVRPQVEHTNIGASSWVGAPARASAPPFVPASAGHDPRVPRLNQCVAESSIRRVSPIGCRPSPVASSPVARFARRPVAFRPTSSPRLPPVAILPTTAGAGDSRSSDSCRSESASIAGDLPCDSRRSAPPAPVRDVVSKLVVGLDPDYHRHAR